MSVVMMHHAANWTNTSTYNCVGIHQMPFHGTEILIISIIYLGMVAMYCVTFIDVALKQAWPEKLLDPEVLKRIHKLKDDFPGIPGISGQPVKPPTKVSSGSGGDEDEDQDEVSCDTKALVSSRSTAAAGTIAVQFADGKLGKVQYDGIVSQEPYIATCCVDEDLTYMLANGDCFGTVSSYCSCTVRGYAMLSTMLLITGMMDGFLWVHRAMIDPIGENYARYGSLLGYFLIFMTGIVMTGPNARAIHRNRNIMLWGSIGRSESKLLVLHDIGVVGFCLVGMLGNLAQLIFIPHSELPNYKWMAYGIACQFIGLLCFLAPSLLQKAGKITGRQANIYAIFGEIVAVLSSMLTFVQVESYPAAACAQMVSTFDMAIISVIFGVLGALFAKKYAGSPLGPYTNGPSVMLMHVETPVAVSGPVPVLNYNREAAILPIVQPKQ